MNPFDSADSTYQSHPEHPARTLVHDSTAPSGIDIISSPPGAGIWNPWSTQALDYPYKTRMLVTDSWCTIQTYRVSSLVHSRYPPWWGSWTLLSWYPREVGATLKELFVPTTGDPLQPIHTAPHKHTPHPPTTSLSCSWNRWPAPSPNSPWVEWYHLETSWWALYPH